MGLERAYRLGEILKSSYGRQATKGWDHFYGESWSLETACKDFNLTIGGGLGWSKNGVGNGFVFHAIIPALYLFWWNFIG